MSNNDINIPEGYIAISGSAPFSAIVQESGIFYLSIVLGDSIKSAAVFANEEIGNFNHNFAAIHEGTIAFSVNSWNILYFSINVNILCERKSETLKKWKLDTFNKIIEAYQEKKAAYDNAVAEAKAQNSLGIQIQGNNPLFNRTIEQQELQKNCLKWLEVEVGNSHYSELNVCDTAEDMPDMDIKGDLACYAQKAKFFEQAFDWDIMSYLFYPYFWGKKCSWKEIYKLDDNDPVFRGFLQAGMARVIVPVRPNYEKAVMYYLETGRTWNGGEAPVPQDPLYVSIIDDLAEQDPTPVGEPWETRLPTSLNILQKDNAAVEGDGLPCDCNDYVSDGTGGSTLSGDDEVTVE